MRWRTAVTLVVLLVVVTGAGWYGWQQFREPVENNPFTRNQCTDEEFAEGSRLRAEQVRVNVYNAGDRDGLAGQILDRLQRQGFLPGIAENAPSRLRVDTVAIYGAQPESVEVRLVRTQFSGRVTMRAKPDIGEEGVDVVVGSGFRGFDRTAPRFLRVRSAEEICVPPTTDAPPDDDRDGRGRGREGRAAG